MHTVYGVAELGSYLAATVFFGTGVALSVRQTRLHPLLLVCVSAASFSWVEAPYDWAMYAQFPPGLTRMPQWWPADYTWGGLPAAVPTGYMGYFALPAVVGAALGRTLTRRAGVRRPFALLGAGFVVGMLWALVFNGILGARLGVFYYGYVIEGLALREGTRHQYPWYDALAMAIQVMAFAYVLGRTDARGRSVVEVWAVSRTSSRLRANLLSLVSIVLIGHALYLSVFAPHLVTKLMGVVDVGPSEQLFERVPNQPVHGFDCPADLPVSAELQDQYC